MSRTICPRCNRTKRITEKLCRDCKLLGEAPAAATAILKTWPAFMPPRKVLEVFRHPWGRFYFTLGRGRPKRAVDQIFFTYRGRILGSFTISEIVQNAGQLPKLRSLSDQESEWQIRGDAWVAVCPPPFFPLKEKIYHPGFRGWRYFDLNSYRGSLDSKIRL